MSVENLSELAFNCGAFEEIDCRVIETTHTNLKMNRLLKRLIRKGKRFCTLIIQTLKKINRSIPDKLVGPDAIQQLTDIQRHTLEHHTHLVCHEIDLSRGVPDMLFERNIIDIDDHDAIDDTERKKEKREKMMQILFDKENDDWIPHLIQILCETGHNNLVDDLRCFQNGQGEGRVVNQPELPPCDFEINLHALHHNREHFNDVLEDRGHMQEVIQHMIDSNIMVIREGSVIFLIRSTKPEKIMSIIQGSDTELTRNLLQRLFDSNVHLLKYFGNNAIVTMTIKRVTMPPRDVTNVNGKCSDCLYTTIRDNYQDVLDEIEDDIINETFANIKNRTEDEQQRMEISETKTLSKKAHLFLQYVWCDAIVLQAFMNVFEKRSQLKINKSRCVKCESQSDTIDKIEKEFALKFELCAEDDDKENAVIRITKSGIRRPSSDIVVSTHMRFIQQLCGPSIIWKNIARPILLRKMSVHGMEKIADYRIIVMDETCDQTCQSFIDSVQDYSEWVFRFCHMPRKEDDNDSKRMKTAKCIILASPGPHVFVLLVDVSKIGQIKDTIRTYEHVLGSDFTDYLVIGIKVDENRTIIAEECIQSFMNLHNLPKGENRCFIFDNVSNREKQAKDMIRLLVKSISNEGKYFINEVFKISENVIKKTEEDIEGEKVQKVKELTRELKKLQSVKISRATATKKVLSTDTLFENVGFEKAINPLINI